MNARRALVAYESGYGTTAEVADRIGTTIAAAGHLVDVRHVAEVTDVDDYDLVVVGSAIRYDRWMSGATEFVRTHRVELGTTNLGFFFTCLALSKPGARSTRSADQYEARIRAVAPELEPLAFGRFAGAVDPSRMNPLLRAAARVFLAVRGARPGDFRDWTAIDAWATELTATIPTR